MNITRILDLTRHNAHAEEDDSSIMWFADQCLNNGVMLDSHVRHAERTGDRELAHFFRRAQRAIKQAHNRRASNRTSIPGSLTNRGLVRFSSRGH